MYDTKIDILALSRVKDEYNELSDSYEPIAICYAQKTENGGRENLYASRMIHENEIVYTIRYRKEIKVGQFILDGGALMKITSLHEEGRRKYMHLKVLKSDAKG